MTSFDKNIAQVLYFDAQEATSNLLRDKQNIHTISQDPHANYLIQWSATIISQVGPGTEGQLDSLADNIVDNMYFDLQVMAKGRIVSTISHPEMDLHEATLWISSDAEMIPVEKSATLNSTSSMTFDYELDASDSIFSVYVELPEYPLFHIQIEYQYLNLPTTKCISKKQKQILEKDSLSMAPIRFQAFKQSSFTTGFQWDDEEEDGDFSIYDRKSFGTSDRKFSACSWDESSTDQIFFSAIY